MENPRIKYLLVFESNSLINKFIGDYGNLIKFNEVHNTESIYYIRFQFDFSREYGIICGPKYDWVTMGLMTESINNLVDDNLKQAYYVGTSTVSKKARYQGLGINAKQVQWTFGDILRVNKSYRFGGSVVGIEQRTNDLNNKAINNINSISDSTGNINFDKYHDITICSIDNSVYNFYRWCSSQHLEKYFAMLYVTKVGSKTNIMHPYTGMDQCINVIFGFDVKENAGVNFNRIELDVFEFDSDSDSDSDSDTEQVAPLPVETEEEDVENEDTDITCKICYTSKKNIVMIPCGHTFCNVCYIQNNEYTQRSNRRNTCMTCKKNVSATNKIFL